MADTPPVDPKDIVIEQLQARIEELEREAAPFAAQIAQRKTYTVTQDYTCAAEKKP